MPERSAAGVVRSPDDKRVLEAALAGRAEFVVSGDLDLIAVGEFDGVRVARPTESLAQRVGEAPRRLIQAA